MDREISRGQAENELTTNAFQPRLKGGDIFMADENAELESSARERPPWEDEVAKAPEKPKKEKKRTTGEEEEAASDSKAARALAKQAKEKILESIVKRFIDGEIQWEDTLESYQKISGTEEERLQEALGEYQNTKPKDSEELIAEAYRNIQLASDAKTARTFFVYLIAQIDSVERGIQKTDITLDPTDKKLAAWYEAAREVLDQWRDPDLGKGEDINWMKNTARKLETLDQQDILNRLEKRNTADIINPQGLEDVIGLIVSSEIPIWRPGGEKELINKEGEIQMENFLEWVREKIIFFHEFSPDSEISLFNDINIPTPYRQISLGEMIKDRRYFRKRSKAEGWVEDENYTKLKEHLLYEVWLFENNHNFDAKYRVEMGGEEKAVQAMLQIHMLNIFTKDKNRLYNVLTLPTTERAQVMQTLEAATKGENRQSGGVGEGIREALVAYNYLYEIEYSSDKITDNEGKPQPGNMFENVLGEEGTKDFYRGVVGHALKDRFARQLATQIKEAEESNKAKGDKLINQDHLLDYLLKKYEPALVDALMNNYGIEKRDEAGNPDTEIIRLLLKYKNSGFTDKESLKAFTAILLGKTNVTENGKLKDLNYYGNFGRRPSIQGVLNEGMEQAIGRRLRLSQQDAKYAISWAFPMTYWTGISARNDVTATGFDGLSKLMNFKDYRVRQAKGRGRFGDEETLYGGVNRIAMTMWESLRVEDEVTGKEKPLMEVLQGGWGSEVDFDKIVGGFNFAEGSQENVLTAQHYSNGINAYKFYMDEHGINFDSFLTRDSMGRLIVKDPKKVDEIRSKVIKFARYTWDMGRYYYDRQTRGWVLDKDGDPSAKVQTLGEFMFGEEVRDMDMYDLSIKSGLKPKESLFDHAYRARTDDEGNYLDSNGRIVGDKNQAEKVLQNMSRNVIAWTIAMEILKHRKFESTSERWNSADLYLIEQLMKSLPVEIEESTQVGRIKKHHTYFNKKQWKKLAETGEAGPMKVFKEETKIALASASLAGLWAAIQAMLKQSLF